jgi:hypothetical protein
VNCRRKTNWHEILDSHLLSDGNGVDRHAVGVSLSRWVVRLYLFEERSEVLRFVQFAA